MVATTQKTTGLQKIAEDIKAKYQSGESTQSELAESFHVTVSAINKLVKGVKPEKRKYHRNQEKLQRNEKIVAAYKTGTEVKQLAKQFNMTHQNVSLILKEAGIKPQSSYIAKLKEQGAETKARIAAQKEAKKIEKLQAVQQLSTLWKGTFPCKGGCTIEEFRVAANLKSVNSAQVKLVLLRKAYGDEMFPRRNRKLQAVEEVVEQETQEIEFVANEIESVNE